MKNYFIIFIIILISCNNDKKINFYDYDFFLDDKIKVIYFLAPECPLSVNYTLTIRELDDKFSDLINSIIVFPGDYYKTSDIEKFISKFNLKNNYIVDNKKILTKYFKATITPEVFVIDSNNNIVYSGKIDNWVDHLGKRKKIINENYLKDAILAIKNNNPISIRKTKPIGCIIE